MKKTVTVDKSQPLIPGKVNNIGSTQKTSHAHSASGSSSSLSKSNNISMNGPKLGGLFEGMATMPRLKPVENRTKGKW